MKEENSSVKVEKTAKYCIVNLDRKLNDILFDNLHHAVNVCAMLNKTCISAGLKPLYDVKEILN